MEKYIKPTMTVVDVEIQTILAASDPLVVEPNKTNDADFAKDQAFGFNVWGEDED